MINKFLTHVLTYKSQATYNTYKNLLQKWININGDIDLSIDYINHMMNSWKSKNLSSSTLFARLNVIKEYARFADENGLPVENLKQIEKLSIKVESKPTETISFEQLDTLEDSMPDLKYRLMVRLLFETGVRVSEAANIKLSDIKSDHVTITYGKGGKFRVVPLTPKVKNLMFKFMKYERLNTCDFLFTTKNGQLGISTIERMIRKYSMAAGIEVHPHTLRHSCFTTLMKANVPLEAIRQIAGHANYNTLNKYLHVNNQQAIGYANEVFG